MRIVDPAVVPVSSAATGLPEPRSSTAGSGSRSSGGRPIRRSTSLRRSSARGPRRVRRKSSDSGMLRRTTGIMTAEQAAPKTKAERQP